MQCYKACFLDGSCSMACLKIRQNIAWGYSRNSLVSCAATAAVCARAVCKSCWGKHKVVDSLANQARSTGGDAHKKWMVTMATLSRTNRGLSCPAFAPVTTTIAQPNPRPTTDPVRSFHTYVSGEADHTGIWVSPCMTPIPLHWISCSLLEG